MTDMTIEKTFQRVGRWLRNDVPNCSWDCVKMIDLAEGRSLRSVMGCYLLTLWSRGAADGVRPFCR
jgi:hypothetical protein